MIHLINPSLRRVPFCKQLGVWIGLFGRWLDSLKYRQIMYASLSGLTGHNMARACCSGECQVQEKAKTERVCWKVLAWLEVNLSALDFSKRVQARWSVCAARSICSVLLCIAWIMSDFRTIPRALLSHFIEIYKQHVCLWKNIRIIKKNAAYELVINKLA
jgi:hypothetical protein